MGFGLPPLNTTDEELEFIMLKEKYKDCNIHDFDDAPVRVCKLEDSDIFTTDFFTFLSEELYKSPCFHPMTREEIEKRHLLPPIGYGLIMVKFDKSN